MPAERTRRWLRRLGFRRTAAAAGTPARELEQARQALAAANARLEEVLDHGALSFWEWHIDSDRFVCAGRWSDFFQALLPGTELTGHGRIAFTHPEDREPNRRALVACLKGETPLYDVEQRMSAPDGEQRVFLVHGRVTARAADGRALRMHGTYTDVTELRLQQRRLELALEAGRQGFFDWWPETDRIQFSASWLAQIGFTAEQLGDVHHDFVKLVHPEDRPKVWAALRAALKGPQPYEAEFRVRGRDGQELWILGRGIVIERDASGRAQRLIGTHVDITMLKRTQEKLDLAASATRQGLWEWLPASDELLPLTSWYELSGYESGDFSTVTACYASGVVHPADVPVVQQALARLAAGPDDNAHFRFRLRARNGEYLHLDTSARAIERGDDGRARRVVGVNSDVSARLRAEERTALAVAGTGIGLWEWLPQSQPEFLPGDSWVELTGHAAQAYPTLQKLYELVHPEDWPQAARMVERVLGGVDAGEDTIVRLRRADGAYLSVLTRTRILDRDEAGRPLRVIGANIDISARVDAEREIHRLVFHDALTGLYNRRYLLDRLEQAMAASRRHGAMRGLVFVDLDRFKLLNDSRGHASGDRVLCEVAARLLAMVRREDVVARLGGDEFVVMLEDLGTDEPAARAALDAAGSKIIEALSVPYALPEGAFHLTPTLGATLFPLHADNAEALLKEADIAMYCGKGDGRNRLRHYDPSMASRALEDAALETELRVALAARALELFYQPQFDLHGRIVGAEALVRWRHPERGFVPPDRFIAIAEQSPLILELGAWVMEEAFAALRRWNAESPQPLQHLAINLSSKQLQLEGFVDHVERLARASGVEPRQVVLEVTERSVISDVERAIKTMRELRALGFRWSVDDFGTGYSSLAYLCRLPLDQLKIDRTFVRDATADANAAVVAQTIIAMGRQLGLETIAEGVETEAQREFLLARGCRLFQGYLLCRPLAFDDLLDYSRGHRAA